MNLPTIQNMIDHDLYVTSTNHHNSDYTVQLASKYTWESREEKEKKTTVKAEKISFTSARDIHIEIITILHIDKHAKTCTFCR